MTDSISMAEVQAQQRSDETRAFVRECMTSAFLGHFRPFSNGRSAGDPAPGWIDGSPFGSVAVFALISFLRSRMTSRRP